MLGRIAATALVAGVITGILIAILEYFTLVPMIRHAEVYEHAATSVPDAGPAAPHDHGGHDHGATAEDGAPSTLSTALLTIALAVGYALLMTGAFAVSGRRLSGREGLLWGFAGFAVFALAPSMGLAPEVPGSVSADIEARQLWWAGCAASTALGLALLVFGKRALLVPVGLLLLAAPHLIGAPRPTGEGIGLAPPELAAEFAATALVVAAIFWSLIGWSAGALYARLGARHAS